MPVRRNRLRTLCQQPPPDQTDRPLRYMTTSDSLIETVRLHLHTAVMGDVLDAMGHRNQFLPPHIRPLAADMMLVGRAMPVLEVDIVDDSEPFGLMFEALDSLQADEVYLATGSSGDYALWGELMTITAQARHAAGAILNGYIRDTRKVLHCGFPIFARGSYAQDQRARGRVVAYRVPVEIGQTVIRPGDLLVGDEDGVLVVPWEKVPEVVERALEKSEREEDVRRAIQEGLGASEAFRTFGVM